MWSLPPGRRSCRRRAAGEVVAGLAADDQVVVAAAIGREADGRKVSRRDDGEQVARVDDVVAVEVVRIGQREHPLVVLVLLVGDLVERVERLGSELVALHVVRVAAVPDAVLARVAVHDERRFGAGRTLVSGSAPSGADDDVVAAGCAPSSVWTSTR
jgi:hypothetical protein